MISKKRSIPLSILKLQALLRRIPSTHPKFLMIKENLSKRLAGYKGEQSIDYPLSFLSEKDYYVLHDLRLFDSTHYFQIDTLVICSNFIIILEVKNIAGTIYFDQDFHQLIRTQDGKETVLKDPLIQTSRQEQQLKKWLFKNNLSKVPILSLVVISNSNTLIRTAPENYDLKQKVINHHFLSTKIDQLKKDAPDEKLSEKEMKKIIKKLQKEHTPLEQSILDQYEIQYDEILKGVICPLCQHLSMRRVHGTWMCERCKHKVKDAHISALKDYYFLFGSEITNQKVRDFLLIASPYLSSRLLHSMNLTKDGTKKGSVHYLSFEDLIEK
jgi:ribosomal protein L37AE/L43A